MNPFTAVGQVKPGPFRKVTINVILYLLNAVTRHFLKPGDLVGVKTIHFARWVFLDDKRRMFFASNYDGSLESYMDDFIDKIAWGLNLVFSNGYGYPNARFLILDGCHDELAFKDYLRLHQVPTRVWYSAYGRLSAANIAAERAIAERASTRTCGGTASGTGSRRCDPRARRHPGALRAGLLEPRPGDLPAARARGRRLRPPLARRCTGRHHDVGRPAGATRRQRRVHGLRTEPSGRRRRHAGPVLQRVRRRDDDAAPSADPRRRRRERPRRWDWGGPGAAASTASSSSMRPTVR